LTHSSHPPEVIWSHSAAAAGAAVEQLLEDPEMLDVLVIALTVLFFVVAAAFTRGCAKLGREKD
jgi:hypothetical protein